MTVSKIRKKPHIVAGQNIEARRRRAAVTFENDHQVLDR
jgi:hypothetical protein